MVVVEVEGWGFTTCSRVWGMSRIRVFGALWGTGPGLPRSKRTSEPNGKEARSVGFHQSQHLVFKTKTNQRRTRVYSNKTTTSQLHNGERSTRTYMTLTTQSDWTLAIEHRRTSDISIMANRSRICSTRRRLRNTMIIL